MATITVTTLSDTNIGGDGLTSLREAVALATRSGDVVNFAQNLFNTTINGERVVRLNTSLIVDGGRKVTIDGDFDNDGAPDFVFTGGGIAIAQGATLTLNGVIVRDAQTGPAVPSPDLPSFDVNGRDAPEKPPGYRMDGLDGGRGKSAREVAEALSYTGRNGDAVGAIVNAGTLKLDNVWFKDVDVRGQAGSALGGGHGGKGGIGEPENPADGGSAFNPRGGKGGHGGDGGDAGKGGGGAPVVNLSTGRLTLDDVMFSNTIGDGGDGGQGGAGGDGGAGGLAWREVFDGEPPMLNLTYWGLPGNGGRGGRGGEAGVGAGTILNLGGQVKFETQVGANGTQGHTGDAGAGGKGGFGGVTYKGDYSPFDTIVIHQGLKGADGPVGPILSGTSSNKLLNQGGTLTGQSAALGNIVFLHTETKILEEDSPPSGILTSSNSYTFNVVRLGGDITKSLTLFWNFVHGTTDAKDLAPGQGVGAAVTIAAGKLSASFTINFQSDFVIEKEETFGISLTNISSGYAATAASTQFKILQNDFGTNASDTIYGTAAADTILAYGGNDMLAGDAGADSIDGGAGNDTVDYFMDEFFAFKAGLATPKRVIVDMRNNTVVDPTGAKDTLTGIETVVGTGLGDIFYGGALPLFRMTLKGSWGNDTFFAAVTGNVVFSGMSTVFDGGPENDVFKLGVEAVEVIGGSGIDTLDASTYRHLWSSDVIGLEINAKTGLIKLNAVIGPDLLIGKLSQVENIFATDKIDIVIGGAEDNEIEGRGGSDTLDGGAGNDIVWGGTGYDIMLDSAGDDAYVDYDEASLLFVNAAAAVTVDMATRKATGNGADTFSRAFKAFGGSKFGDTFNHSLAGGERSDGGAGDDLFKGDILEDVISGGDGFDTVNLSASKAGGIDVLEGLLAADAEDFSVQLRFALSTRGPAILDGIEKFKGTAYDDAFEFVERDVFPDYPQDPLGVKTVFGLGGADRFMGIYGRNTYDGGDGIDVLALNGGVANAVDLTLGTAKRGAFTVKLAGIENVVGDSANDTIVGSAVDNDLQGGDGNDVLSGAAGNDTLGGGLGTDTLSGGLGNDKIDGGTGNDTVSYVKSLTAVVVNLTTGKATGEGTDTLTGIEHIKGSAKADTLTGNNLNNTIDGGAGNDILAGLLGNDTLNGETGFDTADYSAAPSAVVVNLQAGTASGGAGVDKLTGIENALGSGFNDRITGSTSNNDLDGGAGNDILDGDTGLDTLTGGAGRDNFIFDALDAIDVVKDFNPLDDTLRIDDLMFVGLTSLLPLGTLPGAYFVSGPSPVATREAQFLYETDTGFLRFDADGVGGLGPITVLRLMGNPAITAQDIVVI
jgi:Ca2+-binding RTX toxin-like protein